MYRFIVKQGKEKTVLKRKGMFIETKSKEVANNWFKAWKPIFKYLEIKEI